MTSPTLTAPQDDLALAEDIQRFYDDPLGFVRYAYPWKEPNTELANEPGPDANQAQFLKDLGSEVRRRKFNGHDPVMPILMAASSGHGTGKSVQGAWIADWILSTRPYSIGTVTANTYPQLESRTWAQIQRWTRLCITGHWFHVRAQGIYHKEFPETWKVVAQTCKEEAAQSFAGQHARTSTSWYMFDEASHIPDGIWDVASGGLTDGEPMFFAWGQPAKKSGRFYEICFGRHRDRWNVRTIDSRQSRFTNKELIQQWIADYGEDHDYIRVRVRGIAPRAGDLQFIDQDRVDAAKKRTPQAFPDDPLVAGFDVSGGGQAWNVVWFRRGADARSIPPIAIPGEHSQERSGILAKLAEVLGDRRPGRRVSMLFVDSAFGAPYVERLRAMGHDNVFEINFGGPSPDRHQANMRAYMWHRMKEWLGLGGAIPADDVVLETDLTAPGSHLNRRDQLVLESKEDMQKRGAASPDRGDALCFVAGTMVETTHGPVPIEQLRLGDKVITPFGPSPVMLVHVSDASRLTTVQFSDGAVLVGKGEHKVFTFSRGSVRLDALALTDEVDQFSQWGLALWRIVKLFSTGARSSGFKQQVDTFSLGARTRRKDFCIAAFGSTIKALYRQGLRSITSMVTGPITHWQTLSFVNGVSISGAICSNVRQRNATNGFNASSVREKRPQNGIDPPQDWSGTRSTVSRHGKAESPSMQCAPDVETPTKRSSPHARSSAHELAKRPTTGHCGGISQSYETARSAARNFWLTVTGRRPVVPVSVQIANAQPTRTYNLTLAEHNAYYANGILVFNCLTFAAHVPPVTADDDARERWAGGGTGSWMG